jgi:hypothetical protein
VIGRGDTIIVTDPDDEYHGLEGYVTGFETGMLSGRLMANVQLDGRERWDIEAFYMPQIELAESSVRVLA